MKNTNVKIITQCRICSSKDLIDVLDLTDQPIPNGFLTKEELKQKEEKYPLAVCFCNNCSLMQLRYLVNAKVMFDNYLYIPSASKTRIEHFKNLASEIKEITGFNKRSLIVDVGSNDGSLLIAFKNLGARTLGIDPAENLVKVAALSGIETVNSYFDSKVAARIAKKYGKAKAVLATNVIAHINNLHEVIKGGEVLLEDDGVFLMQFPYSLDLIEKNLFDTIYHEHLSYFSLKSLLVLAEKSKLEIFNIEKSELDGGSLKVYWKKKTDKKRKVNKDVIEKILEEEKEFGLYDIKTYERFAKRVEKLKTEVVKKLKDLKKKNKSIVGYGAAAKANVLLNYFGIDKKTINYLVDSTPYKQGKFTPGSHIPIYSEDKIYETNPDYIIIFAWNFAKEIMDKNKRFKEKGGKFILLNDFI